jgi:hypothetical protein
MINLKDLYCYAGTTPIDSVGTSSVQYEIHRYEDTRCLNNTLAYTVVCTHRIVIPNGNPYRVGPSSDAFAGYANYPALVTNNVTLQIGPTSTTNKVVLREMFPRTLNASISTSVDTQSGTNQSSTTQQSSGSSTSQSNTFGVSISAGFFGEQPVGSIALDYSHAWGSSRSSSTSSGSGSGQSSESSSGTQMSVKDWSSYGYTDHSNQAASWIWGQSYPWDVIQYNQSQDGTNVTLPPFIQSRLMTTLVGGSGGSPTYTSFALPPSQLSLFGIDFTMKASWVVEFPDGVAASETVQITHKLNYYTASHEVAGSGATASVSAQFGVAVEVLYTSPPLDLSLYALDPIRDIKSGAAVNLMAANLYTYPPSANGGAFKILSTANNLQVTGTGFAPTLASNFSMGPTTLKVQFKILDVINEYSLLMHHWIGTAGNAINLSIAVNGNAPVTVFVDATEGQGSQGNISTINLRDLDYSSINFHDFLQIGLNTIVITATPVNPSGINVYTLSALAIGQG